MAYSKIFEVSIIEIFRKLLTLTCFCIIYSAASVTLIIAPQRREPSWLILEGPTGFYKEKNSPCRSSLIEDGNLGDSVYHGFSGADK